MQKLRVSSTMRHDFSLQSCLGAWQPSLNISTVLMSIGLLLSEPNPDDGLMCEASREYKYNKQTFDQKARSMTEKYAKLSTTGSSTSSGSTPANPSPLKMEAGGQAVEPRNVDNEYTVNHKKLGRVSQKLSLESSMPSQKRNDGKDNAADTDKSSFVYSQSLSVKPSTYLPMPQVVSDCEEQTCQDGTSKVENVSINVSPPKVLGNVHKLSLKSSRPHQRTLNNDKGNVAQTRSFNANTITGPVTSSDPFRPRLGNHADQQYHQDHEANAGNGIANQSPKRLSGIGRKLSLHSSCSPHGRKGNVDNALHSDSNVSSLSKSQSLCSTVLAKSSLVPLNDNCDIKQPGHVYYENANKGVMNMSSKKSGIRRKLSLETSAKFKGEVDDNKENVPPNYQTIPKSPLIASSSFLMPQDGNHDAQTPHQDHSLGVANGKLDIGGKKPFGITKKVLMQSSAPTQGKDVDEKGDVPVEKLQLLHYPSHDKIPFKSMQSPHAGAHDEEADNINSKQDEDECSPITDAVIVLDSEDSDEEVKGPTRSRLLLARKPLAGKRKAKT